MALTFRFATSDDSQNIVALYEHLASGNPIYPDEIAKQNLATLSAYPGSGILLAEENGTLIASLTLIIIPNLSRGGTPYALIENVVTAPAHRGKGHGKAILKAACDLAWDHGCYKVMLSTGSKKPSVLAFYEAAGFEQSRTGFQMRRR